MDYEHGKKPFFMRIWFWILVAAVIINASILLNNYSQTTAAKTIPTTKTTPLPTTTYPLYASGKYKVGTDIPAGEYVIFRNDYSAAEYIVSADSSSNSEIAYDSFLYNAVITVKSGQYLNVLRGYAVSINDAEVDTTGNGTFLVGKHIKAGEYKIVADDDVEKGYIEICSDSSGTQESVRSNANFKDSTFITVKDGEYLKLYNCHIR